MRIFTIGFTKCSAEDFFGRLQRSGARRVVDIRLNNVSQLAGFAKKEDLRYFLGALCHMDYAHQPLLAPTQELIDGVHKGGLSWPEFEPRFLALLAERQVERVLRREDLDGACLLCSEDTPHKCHRRLVAQYLGEKWGAVDVVDL